MLRPSETVVTTDEKVAFLSSAAAYTPRPTRVDVIETHWSWVFLAGTLVFKLKKPVLAGHFDFRGVAQREANCRKEVRLNRRLAGDVYRGVARLVRRTDGRLAIDAPGETVDWLVVMRRLPADRMLDDMIARSAVLPDDVERLAAVLGEFYVGQKSTPVAPSFYVDRCRNEQRANRAVFGQCDGASRAWHGAMLDRLDRAILECSARLEQRARDGEIVDGHGDLRPEHVCFVDPIVIFDCLEFSDDLRLIDPLDELALLGLECSALDADWIGPVVINSVMSRLGRPFPEALRSFYTAYRACLRARLSLAHLLDSVPRRPEKWPSLADKYLGLADQALARLGV
jgi:aminoglycoside phosphotransferase family enzyme